MDSGEQRQLNKLASRYAEKPINLVTCVLFESEAEAAHWITLRHTGQNEGIGLVEWGADEKDRYAARHGRRSYAGQILDFLEKHGASIETAGGSTPRIITNLTRLINTPKVRNRLGIDFIEGEVVSWYPASEVLKSLARIVEDLKTEQIKVGDIYKKQDRLAYVETIAEDDLPDPASKLQSPKALSEVGDSGNGVKKPRIKPDFDRTGTTIKGRR